MTSTSVFKVRPQRHDGSVFARFTLFTASNAGKKTEPESLLTTQGTPSTPLTHILQIENHCSKALVRRWQWFKGTVTLYWSPWNTCQISICLFTLYSACSTSITYIYVYKPICFGQKRLKKICNKLIANVHFLPVSFCAVVNRLPCPRQDLSVAAAKYTTVRRVKPQLITSNVSLIERSCGPPWHRHASSWPKNSHPRTHQPVCRKQVLWDRDQGLELLRTFVSLSDNRGQRKNKWTLKGSKKWGRGD